jgi:hypothetical protein
MKKTKNNSLITLKEKGIGSKIPCHQSKGILPKKNVSDKKSKK